MITITVKKRNGDYISFLSQGHAGYAEEGSDIICAAVSALVINTVNSIETFTEDSIQVVEKDGYLSISFQGKHSDRTALLMDSLLLGLTQIENSYQRQYLRVKIREV